MNCRGEMGRANSRNARDYVNIFFKGASYIFPRRNCRIYLNFRKLKQNEKEMKTQREKQRQIHIDHDIKIVLESV